ncbi:thiamine pyrophosphate-dependent enzyme [Streptomyces uncialis]|uniref:thiamine pyrophosphate-dependent enzyme n=1 Tax=Streptomyces uncialis TaxID=1048205 RepID=UPI002E346205|nr:thiamine pyrophosphate-dependent enzyme [Streptomyces uncialis]
MITAEELLDALDGIGCHQLCGVPCSYLSRVYDRVADDTRFSYVPAVHEGAGFSTVVGMMLAGDEAALFVQNSGFGNLVNPLTSLALPYRIPVLTFMTMRGWPTADAGEPQHEVMGRTTIPLLEQLGLPHYLLPGTATDLEQMLMRIQEERRIGLPSFILVPSRIPGDKPHPRNASETRSLQRGDAITGLGRLFPDARFVSSTGYISRDLFAQCDQPGNLYLQGAMGHAISVAAGVALRRPELRVVALDGDGSALMHLGAMSTVGHLKLPNLVHVVLDNGRYESTGGQITSAASTQFSEVAKACGYLHAVSVGTAKELQAAEPILRSRGPVLLHVRIAENSPSTGARASTTLATDVLARRFAASVQDGGSHDNPIAGVAGNPVRLGPLGGR